MTDTTQCTDNQAEALANNPPLPGVPLQIRNAPTRLLKKMGYGKEYSYNPDYAHPVHNVSGFPSVSVNASTSTTDNAMSSRNRDHHQFDRLYFLPSYICQQRHLESFI